MAGIIQPVFHQFDQSKIDDTRTNYHLSLQLSIDGFCFALFHIDEKRYIGIGEYRAYSNQHLEIATLKNILQNDPWIKGGFKSVSCVFPSQKSTLIPSPLFNEPEIRTYLALHSEVSADDELYSNALVSAPIRNCFTIPKQWREVIIEYFPNAKLLHLGTTLIEAAIQSNAQNNQLLIHFQGGQFDIVVTNNQSLLFHNSFNYQTSEDVIYYLLYVMEQLALDPNTATILLSGKIVKDSAIYKLLYKYILTIKFAEWPTTVNYAKPIQFSESHQHYPLIQQYLCE
jgi:hypothetical protein